MTIPVATERPEVPTRGHDTPTGTVQVDRCPLCRGRLVERVRGLFCPRCKGWLDGRDLWQGGPR